MNVLEAQGVRSATAPSPAPSTCGRSCTWPKLSRLVGVAGPSIANWPLRASRALRDRRQACGVTPGRNRTKIVSADGTAPFAGSR